MCGVATPFCRVRAYTRCDMGMPGTETAFEELMCWVLGDCLNDGIVAMLPDYFYCGADSLEALPTGFAYYIHSKNATLTFHNRKQSFAQSPRQF